MKKNVMLNSFGAVFYSMCQWLVTILVVHLDSYEASGYLSLAMTTSSSFSAISLFSIRNFQVSDIYSEYQAKEYVGSRVLTCSLAQILCMIVALFLTDSPYQYACICAFMLIRIAESLVDVLHGVNQKYNHYEWIGASFLLRGLATVGIFVLGMLITKDLMLTLFVMAGANLFIVAGFDWRKTKKLETLKPVIISPHVKLLLQTCLPLAIFAFLLSWINLYPKTVLEQTFGAEVLGIYSAMASPTLIVQVFASVAFSPLLPVYTKEYLDGNYRVFQGMVHKLLLFLAACSILIAVAGQLVGRLGLSILFGETILEHYELFLPIIWCTILTAIVWIFSSILIAMRAIRSLLIGMALDFALCVGITKWSIGSFESNGVSIVQIIALVALIGYMILQCEYMIKKQQKQEV